MSWRARLPGSVENDPQRASPAAQHRGAARALIHGYAESLYALVARPEEMVTARALQSAVL
jgi:hypothetical protein